MHREEVRIEAAAPRSARARARRARTTCAGAPSGQRRAHALQGELPQPARRCLAVGDDLARVLVAQLLERERAARGDRERRLEQLGRIELAQPREAAADGARRSGCSARPARSTVVRRRVAVSASCSARRPRACMCTSPAATSGRPSSRPRRLERGEPAPILPAREQLDRDPQPVGKEACEPAAVRRAGRLAGQPQRETVVERVRRLVGGRIRRGRQVVARETVAALVPRVAPAVISRQSWP